MFIALALSSPAGAITLRVGVADFQPDIYLQTDGRPGGILGELLNEIAAREDWTLESRPCHWIDCLSRLQAGTIDLLPDVRYTSQRAQTLDFHQVPVLSRSSQIYAPEGASMDTLEELEGRRIAILAGSAQYDVLQSQLSRLNVKATLLPIKELEDGFRMVGSGAADAAVADYFFGALTVSRYHLSATPIIFDTGNIFYATPERRYPLVLATIDQYLQAWKADPDSVYYRILKRWGQPIQDPAPHWYSHWGILAFLGLMLLIITGYGWYQRNRMLMFLSLFQAKNREFDIVFNQQNQLHEQIQQASFFDTLTDLPNRRLLFTRIEQAMANTITEKTVSAIVMLDIDYFGKINDIYGMAAGDQVLQQVAKRLIAHTFARDTVSRTNGDEFTVLLTGLGTNTLECARKAVSVAQKLLRALISEPVEISGKPYTLRISVGLTLVDNQTQTVADLLRETDIALHRSEALGGNQVVLFKQDIQQQIEYRQALEQDLAKAIENHELSLHVQPQFAVNGCTTGAELLARWHHSVHGAISPGEFIPMAQEASLLGPLTCQFLTYACETVQALQNLGQTYPVSVNVSPQTLSDPLFIRTVHETLNRTSVPANRLIFEITEEIAIENMATITQHMHELNTRGILFSIDDFGTGYANLAYLMKLPVQELKIDKSLIQEIPESEKSLIVIELILSMADQFGLRTVAEGVETNSQRECLFMRGCNAIQGYLLARPMPIADWLDQVKNETEKASIEST
ncbi:EAL domain-containing protein [Castellaniella sp. GW247-6E4]|uniref:putative bifunctional diguanylate cyclase/phosphodiesterase n=1 Tax=Castellaniella sp. GW247-6E4 TaxID=3140380 RepID=UPI00331463BB